MAISIARLRAAFGSHAGFVSAIANYGASQAVMKGLDAVSFALFVAFMTPAELGFMGVMTLSAVFVVDLFALGVPRIGVPRLAVDPAFDRDAVVNSGTAFIAVYAVIMLGLIIAMPKAGLALVGFGDHALPFRLMAVSFLFRAFAYMHLEVLRLEGRSRAVALLEPIPSVLSLIVCASLIWWAPDKVLAASLAQLAAWAPLALYFLIRNLPRLRMNASQLPRILRFSAPATLQRIMDELSNAGDRWVVLLVLGPEATGAYTFLYRIGDVMKIVFMPVQKAFIPQLVRHATRDQRREAAGMALITVAGATAIFLGSLVAIWPLARLIDLGGKFAWTIQAIPIVVFAYLVYTAYLILGMGFYVTRRAVNILPITLSSLVVNLAVSWWLAKTYGVLAVAYGTVAGNAVLLVGAYVFGRRYFDYPDRRPPLAVAAMLAVGAAATLAAQAVLRP